MKKISLLLLTSLLFGACMSQTLRRKASLGFRPTPVDSSMMKQLDMEAPEGMLVSGIRPGGTFEMLGAKDGDVLLNMNKNEINNIPALLSARDNIRAGDEVSAMVLRDGKKVTLKGEAVGLPYETSPHSEVIYDQFYFKDGVIRSIINKPNKPGKHPVIFFIPGYNCGSVDNYSPIHPYRKLLDSLVALGYAVFRMEKPGMGDNLNTGNCFELGFDNELAAYMEGYKQLARYDFMDQENIFLWGHSMGGMYAPLIAKEFNPKGVAVYGIVHDTWTEYLLRMVRYQNPRFGAADYVQTDQDVRTLYALLYEHYHLGKSSKELYQNPKYKTILERDFWFDGENQILQRHEDFWREIYPYNISEAWATTTSHVLSLNGEADIEVINSFSQQELVKIVNHYHPGHGEFVFFPKTDHSMIKVGSLEEGAKLRGTPAYRQLLMTSFNYDIVDTTHRWIQGLIKK